MWVYDCSDIRILDVNAAAVTSYGYSRQAFLSMTIRDLRPESEWEVLEHDLRTAPRGLSYSTSWIHRKADSSLIFADITSQPVLCNGRPARLVLATDVTARHEEQDALRYLAHRDELTGLLKRTYLVTILETSVRNSRCNNTLTGVAFVDLDNFKEVNDTHGHFAGDQVLVDVSQRLSHVVREEDTVSRLGGDEFVVIFSNVLSSEHLSELVNSVSGAFTEPFPVPGANISMSASIGVSVFPLDAGSPETLLRCADEAMYRAKDSLEPVHFFSDHAAGLNS